MKFAVLSILAIVASASSFAADEVVTRTDATKNYTVSVVGQCSVYSKNDINGVEIYAYTLPATNCQEYVTYQANVTGKSWNKKVTPISGTEKYSYKSVEASESATGGPTSDIMNLLQIQSTCEKQRALLVKLAEATQGQSKCSN